MTPERLIQIAVEIERYNHITAAKELLTFAETIAAARAAVRESERHEIEDLWSLADECRDWAKPGFRTDEPLNHDPADVQREFKRLADKLDEIAKRLEQ